MKIAWVITGAGHFLKECFEIVGELNGRAVLFFSKAGLEVTKMYGLNDFLAKRNIHVINDEKASSPSCGAFAARRYEVLVVAPATSNTIAKCALGIADSLPTNLFAQAGKSQIPILVLPSDTAPKIDSVIPSGRTIEVYPRPVDLQNVKILKSFPGVTVTTSVEELKSCLKSYL